MDEIQGVLRGRRATGSSWRDLGRELGVTDVYVAMLADGRRKIRQSNPLYGRILALEAASSPQSGDPIQYSRREPRTCKPS